jgi:hypothetical protein
MDNIINLMSVSAALLIGTSLSAQAQMASPQDADITPYSLGGILAPQTAFLEPILPKYAMLKTSDQLFVDISLSNGLCNEVVVYDLDENDQAIAQILNRQDADLACFGFGFGGDSFGNGIVALGPNRIVVSAPSFGTPIHAPNTSDGEVFIYERAGAGEAWEVQQILTGTQFDQIQLGSDLHTDGTRLFMTDFEIIEIPVTVAGAVTRLRGLESGVLVLSENELGQWHITSRIQIPEEANPDTTEFAIAGDQVLLNYRVGAENLPVVQVYEESSDGAGDWHIHQTLTINNNDAPESLRNHLRFHAVDGDYLLFTSSVVHPEQAPELVIYQRDGEGLWRYDQFISPATTEAVLGDVMDPVAAGFLDFVNNKFFLEGADLIAAWDTINDAHLIHYRLNDDGLFAPVQDIGDEQSFVFNAVIDDQSFFTRSEGAEALAGPYQRFNRDIGSNFTINRGLSGGWWFGPERNGQGVGLEILANNRAQMVWVSHDEQGQQMWMFAGGTVGTNSIQFDLVQPVGGRFGDDFDPATVRREAWGQVELQFDSCDSGVLNYASERFGSGRLPLLRLNKVDGLDCGNATASPLAQRWNGSWFDPSHSGEGMMMYVSPTPAGPRLVSLWMTYNRVGEQVSLFTATDIDSANEAVFESVIRPTGPSFSQGSNTDVFNRNAWGSFVLSGDHCGESRLVYSSVDSAFGSGEQNLIRFTEPLGTGCLLQ